MCGGEIVRAEGEAASRCINTNCPAQLKETILHWAGRGVMNIDGMGDALVDQLVDGAVKNVADLYTFKLDNLMGLERMGKKSAAKVLANIEKSQESAAAANYQWPGDSVCWRADGADSGGEFGDLDKIADAAEDELQKAEEVGPKVARSLRRFFQEHHNRGLIDELRAAGFSFTTRLRSANAVSWREDVCFNGDAAEVVAGRR